MEFKEAIQKINRNENLSQDEARQAALQMMSGETTDAQIAALLTSLRWKGETVDEISGFVSAMREKATKVNCTTDYLVDTCGTGGDNSGTFNVSTVTGFVAAGAGCRVAKHGNRSVSSKCGSADLFKELGVNIDVSPEKMGRCIDENGIGFLFAPILHQAMKYAIGPRREIGIRTLFNIIGPLTNPAGAKRQLLGVYSETLLDPHVLVLKKLGSKHVMVVHGEDGLDEISLSGKTHVTELKDGQIGRFTLIPEDSGLRQVPLSQLQGGDPAENKRIALDILNGKTGSARDIVLLNAGAVCYLAGRSGSINEGIELARESIDSGEALKKLEKLKLMNAV